MLPKDMYKLMLKEYIKPIFKEKGYKKKGNVFVKETDDIVYIIYFLPDRWNTIDEYGFTIDLRVCSKEVLKAIGEPLPNNWFAYNYITPLIESGLGYLRPFPLKSDYGIGENTDINELAREVISDLNEIIFPYVEKLNSYDTIIKELNFLGLYKASMTHKITLYFLLNNREMAQKELLSCLSVKNDNPYYRPKILKIANRLGLDIPIEQE
ncbi:DUF4304 domain-containing protein [Neobacillus sp. PS3-34]|uniref:DUF4304 domain-containing protein n=1 Tax=Neobacillus sp. PS3-34 TaxID=3070678 RepID=UPI0027DFA921|nr:DUF4304 domain-containing protein [Neobacillus sp. PS3-34]WML46626.1 DUF4304 domain-containing protein [Neobacillus sp. PS3-34]